MMKNKALTLSIASIFALLFVLGITSAVTIANWNFDDENLVVDAGAGTLTISDIRTANYVQGNPSTGAALSTSGWDVANRYIQLNVSTLGYQNINLKLDYKSTSTTGPTQFKIQYSTDGTTFTDLTGSTTSISSSFTTSPMSTFNLSSISAINNNANAKLRLVITGLGTTGSLHVDNILVEGVTYTAPPVHTPEEISACTATGNTGDDLRISIDDIKVNGYGKNEEWLPLDEISVDIKVKNENSDEKMKNIAVGWGLYNTDTDEWYVDDEESDFSISKKDSKTVTVTFKLDENIDELADGDYILYVWANGEINTATEKNVEICASDSQDIAMQIESDFVILDKINFVDSAQCGMDVQISADVWNIGSDQQDSVLVLIQNSELGINQKVEIGDISEFDSERLDAIITIPNDVKEKTYTLEFTVFDENGDVYVDDYGDDKSRFTLPLKIEGNCAVESKAVVSASLESGGKAGQDLVIKATVTNTGTKSVTYTLNADGYTSWATLTGAAPTMTLNKGESAEALLTFKVNSDATGEQTFNIEVLSGTNLVLKQPVSVSIESSGFKGFNLGDNWYLWAIGALNVILVIVIIIIAVRVAKS